MSPEKVLDNENRADELPGILNASVVGVTNNMATTKIIVNSISEDLKKEEISVFQLRRKYLFQTFEVK